MDWIERSGDEDRGEVEELPGVELIVRHPARRRILLGLRDAGPMSPADLANSRFGRGIRVSVYSYHFKELCRWGLLEVDQISEDKRAVTRYSITKQLTQSMIDAAALDEISDALAAVPESLSQWIDGPYFDEIRALVGASGRRA